MGTIITSICFAFTPWGIPLALASAWYHYTEREIALRADYVGIYTLSLYALSGYIEPSFWWLLPIAVAGVFKAESGVVVLLLLTIIISQSWLSLILFALAVLCRLWAKQPYKNYDAWHSAWHVLAAAGFMNLI